MSALEKNSICRKTSTVVWELPGIQSSDFSCVGVSRLAFAEARQLFLVIPEFRFGLLFGDFTG